MEYQTLKKETWTSLIQAVIAEMFSNIKVWIVS